MIILGIETSCDETSAAVVTDKLEILSNVVLSQDEIHAPYGGIVPELASRQHIKSIGYVVEECLSRAGVALDTVDTFAVTQGPGLIGSLLVGLSFAKALAFSLGKSLVPIDHLESHVFSAFIENQNIAFPVLALLVSGGHTSLFLLPDRLEFQLIGKTRDDAAGEALDKIAKFLNLGYPGGPIIDQMAEKGDKKRFHFALPQMSDGSLDYSFSGFKTAALRLIKQNQMSDKHPDLVHFLASFENAIIESLLSNIEGALQISNPQSLILCGGVARNRKLRQAFMDFAQSSGIEAYVPSPDLCTDNAAMVAALAFEQINMGRPVGLDLTLNAYARR